MSLIKIYLKGGRKTFQEQKMVDSLSAKYHELKQADKNFEFTPAKDIDELKALFNKYCIDDAEIVSDTASQSTGEKVDSSTSNSLLDNYDDEVVSNVPDPLNESEPIVRDYVFNDGFGDETEVPDSPSSDFSEPTDFDSAFDMPVDENMHTAFNEGKPNKAPQPERPAPNQASSDGSYSGRSERENVNPAYDTGDNQKNRKKTKRFVKQIVELTSSLIEQGFVWYTSKDITESKLTQYELSGEMDLSLLVTLSDEQQITIKEYFIHQNEVIKEASKISPEEKEDLIEAMTEVFLEKGIAPTPMQELMLTSARILGLKAVQAFSIVSSNNALLAQLRNQGGTEDQEHEEQPQEQQRSSRPVPMDYDEMTESLTKNEPKSTQKMADDVVTPAVEQEPPFVAFAEIATKE